LNRALPYLLTLGLVTLVIGTFIFTNDQGGKLSEILVGQTPTEPSVGKPASTFTRSTSAEGLETSQPRDTLLDSDTDLPVKSEGSPDSALLPEQVLSMMFARDALQFGKQLESHYLSSEGDDEWTKEAAASLAGLFSVDTHSVVVDCAVDICLMDIFASYRSVLVDYRPELDQWKDSAPVGFLPAVFYFKNGDGSYRFYFFRDSFDPGSLHIY
jgi:hypothetical protein